MNSFTLDEIYVGQKASVTKTITRGDIYAFAGLVDDYSPVHIDKAFGEQSPFGRCIAHGFLSGALFSTLAGNYLPGAGSLYVRQSLNFLRPVYAGDTITATFEVVKKGRGGHQTRRHGKVQPRPHRYEGHRRQSEGRGGGGGRGMLYGCPGKGGLQPVLNPGD